MCLHPRRHMFVFLAERQFLWRQRVGGKTDTGLVCRIFFSSPTELSPLRLEIL